MSTNNHTITVSGIEVHIVRKKIKNLHLAIFPPDGHVRVSVPLHVTDDNIRLAVISKLSWIKKQQANFKAQPRQSQREMLSGESHYFFGRRYRIEVVERRGKHEVILKPNSKIQLFVNPNTKPANREKVLIEWYRSELKKLVPVLIQKWEPIIGVKVNAWGVKKMKTKWGSCNIFNKRIWLNLDLAKKPYECLEYIIVHEMVHLLERHHNDNFRSYMDQFMPPWRSYQDLLKKYPLAHEEWEY